MKVLLIHTYYSERGGEDVVFEAEIGLLKNSGCEVESLTFNNSNNKIAKLLHSHFNILSYYRTKRKIRQFKPDVLHIHNWHFAASPSIIWAANRCKTPIVMTLHNYRLLCPSAILFHDGRPFFESLAGGFPWTAVKKKVYRNSALLTFWLATILKFHQFLGTWKIVDRFITLSDFARNIYLMSALKMNDNKIIVKPNFINKTDAVSHEKEPGFVFVGRLSEEKGLDVLFKAFQIRKFRLTIIGDGPLKQSVVSFAKKNPEIIYLGYQKKEVVEKVLQNNFALLFCSKCYEGMPMTILESFAHGTPVIASSIGPIPDIVIDQFNGLLYKNNDEHELADKIREWIEMPASGKQKFYTNSRETYLKKFSADENLKQLLTVYEQLL